MPPSRRHDAIVTAIRDIVAAPAGEPWETTRARIEHDWPPPQSVWDGYAQRFASAAHHGEQPADLQLFAPPLDNLLDSTTNSELPEALSRSSAANSASPSAGCRPAEGSSST